MTRLRPYALCAFALSGAFAGCNCNPDVIGGNGGDGSGNRDMMLPPGDFAGADLTGGITNACGDNDPSCTTTGFGPPQTPFPLQSDNPPNPNESDQGVNRDPNGYIQLSASASNFDFLWLANTDDWGSGTVAKIDSKNVKEVARYLTVTCYSNPGGSRAACDGTNGCCSGDDYYRFQARVNNQAQPGHQPVQTNTNYPSRTAVDYNGDVWISNRAFSGQSSVTKIANDISECVDRNGTPGIQTSTDVDGNGVIDADCNRNNKPDDIADVKAAPCVNGKAQEFYGLDDECLLFTTNTNTPDQWGRPLALGQGSVDFGPSDAWAGGYQNGTFFRIDGSSGQTKAQAQVPVFPGPYGAAVDASGIAWVSILGGGQEYFDTVNPANAGKVRAPSGFTLGGYGITLDRDQNVWQGGYGNANAYRYTPDRSNGFASLGSGYWTEVLTPGQNAGATGSGRGIAADSRSANAYFVWMARDSGGWVSQIPGSAIPKPMNTDTIVDGSGYPAMKVAGSNTIGAGVDVEQNIWGISNSGSVATRIKVDVNGAMTAPNIAGGGGMSAGCPGGTGDYCNMQTSASSSPDPYTYSDFTGFGLRNFTNPKGYYAMVMKGCSTGDTHWFKIDYLADVPPNTTLTVRARSGMTPVPDNTWGMWTGSYSMTPADLAKAPGPMLPNPAPYMQVEFDLATTDRASTPKLKAFDVVYECGNIPG